MEREILFCLTALQMGLTTSEQLKEIGRDLSEKKIGSLRAELIRKASISPEKVKIIEHSIDLSVSLNNGNYKKLLSLKIYRRLVREAFGDSISISQNGELRPSYPKIRLKDEITDIHTVTEEPPDRYSTIKDIGSGGIGKVILAYDRHTGRNIAIKELLPEGISQTRQDSVISTDEARFLREARLTAQLEHPSIIPVYEIGRRANNSIYYTMKFVKGRTLSEELRNSNTLSERLRFLSHFVNLCNAIAYAHSKGVIHRDIKPHNVMIGEFGETVVLDWGLAKIKNIDDTENEKFANQMRLLKDAAAGRTVAGEVMGTPQYMSPEQAWGDVNNIDEKSDIYSLGAVLYEILTGFPPFEGDSPIDIVKDVRAYLKGEKRLIPVKDEEPECPDELAAIAERALSASREKRYQSVVDLIDDVEAYMAGRKVSGHKYSLFSYMRYVLRREKVSFTFTFIVLFIISVALYFIIYINNIKRETDIRLYSEKIFSSLNGNDYISAAYYAILALKAKKSDMSLFEVSKNHFASSLINAVALPEKNITALDISSDSKFLAAGTAEGTISLFNLSDLKSLTGAAFSSPITRIVFSSENDRLAAGFQDGTIRIFNLHPFSLIKTIKDFSTPVKGIAFTDGGRYFVAAAGQMISDQRHCPDCAIRIYSTDIFKFLDKLSGHTKAVTDLSFSNSGKYLISSSYDGYVIFWDIFSKKEIKRININSPVLDISVQKEKPIAIITEEGKTITIGNNFESEIISVKSYNHHLVISTANHIITGGGAFSQNRCRFCDLKIYDQQKNISIFQGFKDRITGLNITPDSRLLLVSDEKGNIFVFDFAKLMRLPHPVNYKYLLSDEPSDMRCIKTDKTCYILNKSYNMTNLLLDKVESENRFNINPFITESFSYIINRDLVILNPYSGGLFYLNPSTTVYENILSEPIKIQSLKISNNNEFIGVTDTEDTFYLLKKAKERINDTQIREKNILSFAFLPDSQSIHFLRAEFNAANERFYTVSLKELMTDSYEKLIVRTGNELTGLISFENPFIVGNRNTFYISNKNGILSEYKIPASFKIKKLIHIPKSTCLLLLFEDKKYAAIYDIAKNKIVSYLIGHTESIYIADVLEDGIFTIGTDGTVIVYKAEFNYKTSLYSDRETEQEVRRLKKIMNNLKLFYPE